MRCEHVYIILTDAALEILVLEPDAIMDEALRGRHDGQNVAGARRLDTAENAMLEHDGITRSITTVYHIVLHMKSK